MAQPSAPPLQDKEIPFSHQDMPVKPTAYAPVYPEPPPPYSAYDPATPQPSVPYPTQGPIPVMPHPVMPHPPVQVPVQQSIAPPPQPAQIIVVGAAALPPGTCTVCRKGKLKKSASFWTWLCCCLLLPVGILPGLCVFCCCCHEPKCTNCGYTP
ncbi:hypothetical protein GWK47_022268 [Chionoecetes opilio]|uniref:Membrane protein BRI3 n=1 Tax=Chionoecetes opilio TaxID=41210 RepID=A0A8J4XNP9_CHIOP|nr:hypothetical protein GWK47_022268 [Chionoecetes opilio]